MDERELRIAIQQGIDSPFWTWMAEYLVTVKNHATKELTSIEPIPDNLGRIARLQEQAHLATLLLKRPYDSLGIRTPGNV